MTSNSFFEHFATLADAPGGIPKLRELILQLAVQGELVPQDANDEPVAKSLKADLSFEPPYSIPKLWSWIRVGDLLPEFQNGVSSRGESQGTPTVVLRLADIKEGNICLADTREMLLPDNANSKYALESGDILIVRVNGSAEIVGRFIICREKLNAIYCDHFIRLRVRSGLAIPDFLGILGRSPLVRGQIGKLFITTAGQKTVNQGHVSGLSIPIPPPAEQKRIVAKVDRFMALCDALEAQQQARHAVRSRLHATLLGKLQTAANAADFARAWQRLRDHFAELFAPGEAALDAVAQLRQTILQLAVQGRLVPQNAKDQPAEQLITTIQETRKKPMKELPAAFSDGELLYDVWPGWKWARFQEVATIASNLVQPAGYLDQSHIAPDNIEKHTGKLLEYRTVGDDKVRSGNHRFFAGQILYSKIRPNLAKAVIVSFDGLCSADMYPIDSHIDAAYLLVYMLSPPFLRKAVRKDTRVAMPKINQVELNSIPVPVPPLAEQQRIVAKVQQLMAQCDALEASLKEAASVSERWSAAALRCLLDGAATPAAGGWQGISDPID